MFGVGAARHDARGAALLTRRQVGRKETTYYMHSYSLEGPNELAGNPIP